MQYSKIDIEGWHPIDSKKGDDKNKDRHKERIDLALTMENATLDERFVFSIKRFNLEDLVCTSTIRGTRGGCLGFLRAHLVYGVRNMEDPSGIPFFVVKEKFIKLKEMLNKVKVADTL